MLGCDQKAQHTAHVYYGYDKGLFALKDHIKPDLSVTYSRNYAVYYTPDCTYCDTTNDSHGSI